MPPNLPQSSPEKAVRSGKESPYVVVATQGRLHKPSPPEPPLMAGCLSFRSDHGSCASQGDFVQADVLESRPDNGQATGLRREHVDLISALSDIAEETFNRIGGGQEEIPTKQARGLT